MAQHVFIAGGSSGIGLATASAFVSADWRVTIGGRSKQKLLAASKKLAGVDTVVMDASDALTISDAMCSMPDVTTVVVTVGSDAGGGNFADMGSSGFVDAVRTKAGAQLTVLQALLESGNKIECFIFVSGAAGRKGGLGMEPLTAANATIKALVPVVTKELAPLRINAVSPGFVATPIYDGLSDKERDELIRSMAKGAPIRRTATANEVASAIKFGVENGAVNGAVLAVDGGIFKSAAADTRICELLWP